MKKIIVFIIVLISVLNINSYGQKFTDAIEDNSFFIEEAYNQEDYVVQHISTGLYNKKNKDFGYSFTQEWPAFGITHQLSYTIPVLWKNENNKSGIGDIMLNYRLQVSEHDDWAAFSPRFSISLPTGKEADGFGNGVVGFQVNLPFSKRLTNEFIVHYNLGTTILPNIKTVDESGNTQKNTYTSFFTGASIIWLTTENFNIMLEYILNENNALNESNKKIYNTQHIVCPGLRYAVDVSKLQIVPGVALPITIEDGNSRADLFFYLSFEHPF